MRLDIIGGGPAGTYLAALIGSSDTHVFEAREESDLPGGSLVFGAGMLDELLVGLDTKSVIEDLVETWRDIEIHRRESAGNTSTIRLRSKPLAAISRASLLELLRDVAAARGVCFHFGQKVDPNDVRSAPSVFADGISSSFRQQFSSRFGVSETRGKNLHLWCETDVKLDAFVFDFVPFAGGWAHLHAYPGNRRSTAIIELDRQAAASLGVYDGAAVDPDLISKIRAELMSIEADLRPLSNAWQAFSFVQCQTWSDSKRVLLGDAAHSAHFSVGAGTRLAMLGARSLASALSSTSSFTPACDKYEREMRPIVGRMQRSASQSQKWFEESSRVLNQPIERVAFSLMTRTKRMTFDELAKDDSLFAKRVIADWRREQHATLPIMTPIKVGSLSLANRIAVSPMCQYSAVEGMPGDWHLVHYGSRAVGGAGVVFSETCAISADARISVGCAGIWSDGHAQAWRRIIDFVHRESDAKFVMQLGHAGRKGATHKMWEGSDVPLSANESWSLIAPSALPWNKNAQVPREMSEDDIAKVLRNFERAASFAKAAGADGIEIHLAHGYLLSSFISPLTNQREDLYGGSLENRLRFPLEVIHALRKRWKGMLACRINVSDWTDGGMTFDDAMTLASRLKSEGVDLLDISSGQTTPESSPTYGRAYHAEFSSRIRQSVGIPTMVVGNIFDADRANTVLLARQADLIAFGRSALLEPSLPIRMAFENGVRPMLPKPYEAARSVADKIWTPKMPT